MYEMPCDYQIPTYLQASLTGAAVGRLLRRVLSVLLGGGAQLTE